MPWSPDWQVDLDPRLDPYRDRVADASLEMTWLTQDEAIAIAPDVFGVTWCLIDHGVNWSWPDEA